MAVVPAPFNPQLAIWKCLNGVSGSLELSRETISWAGPAHSDSDFISLRDITGVDVGITTGQSDPDLNVTPLNTDENVRIWLPEPTTNLGVNSKLSLRLLIGRQVSKNDGLRPPVSLEGTNIRKSHLFEHFKIPLIVPEKLGYEVTYTVDCPPLSNCPSTLTSHGIVGGTCSIAWSHDTASKTTRALIVLRHTASIAEATKTRILELLELLKVFSNLPSIVPYLILESTVNADALAALHSERDALMDQGHLLNGLTSTRPFEMFGEATIRSDRMSSVVKHANTILTMSRQDFVTQLHRPDHTSDEEWNRMKACHDSLQQLIDFRRQELEHIIAHSNYLRGRSDALQSTVMGLMSFNQQETTYEISKRTKEDGTAMKTLAVMAALYLPATAIATVMSMPVFNWDTGAGGAVTDSKIWIFFVVAVPMTALTMAAFWLWVTYENEGSLPTIKLPISKKLRKKLGISPDQIV